MKKKFVNQNPRNIAGFKHVRIQMCKWYPHFCHTFTLSTSNPISALISSQVLSFSGSSFHMAEWGPLQSLSTQSSLWPQRQTSFLCSFYLLSTLAWKIPWMEEPGGLQSMGSLRVWHDWATSLSLSCIGEGNGNPLQCSCLENPRDGKAWWAAIYGVAESRTRLKRLSISISSLLEACLLCLPGRDITLWTEYHGQRTGVQQPGWMLIPETKSRWGTVTWVSS